MISSKLSGLAQTTIPEPVRDALHLQDGDVILYTIEADGRVVITKSPVDHPIENPFSTFSEWDSEADRRAYADL